MAKSSRDLILRDRLQFDVNASGDTGLVYGRIDMSDYVNVVKREGLAIKEIRYQIRQTDGGTGVFNPLLGLGSEAFASLKIFATTTAYENATDVGIASPDVISVFELTTVRDNGGAADENFANQWVLFGTPDLHPDGYNIVSDLLVGVSANDITTHSNTTLELDIMVIGEPVKLNEADMTEMLTQAQDLWGERLPTDQQGRYYSRRINLSDEEELAERLTSGAEGAMTGAKIGSLIPLGGTAVGATLGGIAGFILGDQKTVFPVDMIAIPAYQAYLIQGTPAFQIYIKEGEVLTQVIPTDAMEATAVVESVPMASTKKRKPNAWNRYCAKKSNQIVFKSGKKKGLLNLKAMGVQYRKGNRSTKKKGRKWWC